MKSSGRKGSNETLESKFGSLSREKEQGEDKIIDTF